MVQWHGVEQIMILTQEGNEVIWKYQIVLCGSAEYWCM